MKFQIATGLIVTLMGSASTEILWADPFLVVNENNGDMRIEVRGEDWVLSAYQIISTSESLIPDPDPEDFSIPGMGTLLLNTTSAYAAGIPIPPPATGFPVVEEGVYPLGIRFSGEDSLIFESVSREGEQIWPVEYIPEPSGVCLMVLGMFGLGPLVRRHHESRS